MIDVDKAARPAALALLLILLAVAITLLAGCADKAAVVVQTRDVERRPPPTYMVPCAREPEVPAVIGGKASAAWVADVIAAGEDCRRRSDDLQRFHNQPAK